MILYAQFFHKLEQAEILIIQSSGLIESFHKLNELPGEHIPFW